MTPRSPLPELETERLRLELPDPSRAVEVVDYYERNRDHLRRWDPRRPEGFYTVAFWQAQLASNRQEFHLGRNARFFIRPHDRHDLVIGSVNLSNFVRGVFQACHLGFGIDAQYEGSGRMREALERVLTYAFDELELHRVMANYQPTNERSGALLRRLGFATEGFARDFLFIDGAWRDHVLTARVAPPRPTRR